MDLLTQYGADGRYRAEATIYPEWELARVIAQYRGKYRLVFDSGESLAEVSGRFRHEALRLSDYPAVGDFVMAERPQDGEAVIRCVLTRKSCFERPSVSNRNEMQTVAANADVVFICMSLNSNYNINRLERYLSVAWNSRAKPVVVLTKSDLCDDPEKAASDASHIAIDTDIVLTSSIDEQSVAQLRRYIEPGMTATFIGSSGVGKSTLINLLIGSDTMATGEIREDDGRGRHTTTGRELHLIPDGGVVMDTPGMRELGAESSDIERSFAEIEELAQKCRFADCTHTGEPSCAVLAAVEGGTLDARRLQNYLKLKKEAGYDGMSSQQIEGEKIRRMFGGKSAMKKQRDYFKSRNDE